ncbi:hypothetical protein BJ875DRAFT_544984 [Amylocarpus encephaloides]|uniref:DUF4211 domain-containing protein n=1 Tax=Amylocarpus encephaloides TaxID=45428 RepID=A0A9P7YF96_9HELO|nr:hypothetical protein BJ875DRAFT_544984 [Amylocarpus encephaloides]
MMKHSNFGRKASRGKKQTRLSFEDAEQLAASLQPAPQLTPAKDGYQLRNRALSPSPSKKARNMLPAIPASPSPLNNSDDEVIHIRKQGLGSATPKSTSKELSDPDDVVFPRGGNLSRHDKESEDVAQGGSQGMFSSSRPTQGWEDDSDDDESNQDSDSEPIIISSTIRKLAASTVYGSEDSNDPIVGRKRLRKPISDEEVSDESDVRPSAAKRRHPKSTPQKRPPRKILSRSDEGSTSDSPAHLTRKHTAKRRPRTDKEKALELLKRKKAGGMRAELTISESSSNQESDSENQLQHLSDFEDESEEEVEESPKPSSSRRVSRTPKTKSRSSKEDEYEEDFIVDDDDDTLGIPTQSIPLEFTAHFNKPQKEHFKDVVEYYVHKELNPTYFEKDDIFERAFQRLDDKPSTLRRSEYGSSQWTAEFDTALDARPNYIEHDISGTDMGEQRCQACGRSKHTPTWSISFRGKAYDRDTLDEIEQTHEQHDDSRDDDWRDDDTSDSDYSVDGLDRRLVPEDHEFLAGRFCRAKAKKAHMLSHWRYHLYKWVCDELTNEPELSAERMLARRKLRPWEKRDEVEGIIERWSHNGKIKRLYCDYKESVSKLEAIQDTRWG